MTSKPSEGETSNRRIAAVVGVVSFALYAVTLSRTVPFGDGGELIGAANSFGVAHPPGYPLYTMVGWLALRIPLGEPAARINLLSAVFAALACATATWLILRLTRSRAGALAAGFGLAVSSTFWSVATVTEVYSLHAFLMLVMLAGATVVGDAPTRRGRTIGLIVAAVALGAGLAHHPTIVLALPAAALLAVPGSAATDRSRRRWLPDLNLLPVLIGLMIVVVVPVAFYLGLMLRARQDPLSNWGRPVDLGSLWYHASAVAYRHLDLGWAGLLRASSWARLGRLLLWEMTPLAPLLALLGLSGLPRSTVGVSRLARLAIAALIVAVAIFGLRFGADDIAVFYLPGFVGLALAVGLGVAALRRAPDPITRSIGWVVAVVVVLASGLSHYRTHDLRGVTAAEDYGHDILDTLPQGASLIVETDDAFPLVYLTQVRRERQDVRIFQRDGHLFENLVELMRLPRDRGEPWGAYRNRVEQAFIDRELSQPGAPGVFFLGWPGYEPPPRYRMEPVGLLYRISDAAAPPADVETLWDGYRERRVREQAIRTGDEFALVAAATYAMARGERAMHDGEFERAEADFEQACRLGPWDAPVHNYIGLVYGRFGRYDRAIDMFRRATVANPVSVRAWNNLGKASLLSGDREQARRAWNRSLKVLPGQTDVIDSLRQLDAAR